MYAFADAHSQVWQVTVDTSLLPGNGNTSLQ
jgi:hypothetical protein